MVPDVLPDEVLAAEPYVRPSSPAVKTGNRPQTSKRHIIFASEERPVKDMERRGVKIRVLNSGNLNVPPKAGKAARSLREQWLAGRKGKKGVPVYERRKVGSGFLRR